MAQPTRVQVISAACVLVGIVVFGGVLLWELSGETYSLFESIYFALITVSTVGYGELPDMEFHPAARVFVMALIIAGVGAVAFFQSTLTAMLVEGAIGRAFRRRRMQKAIDALTGHFIVVGCGRTGVFVVEEFAATRRPYVVIDRDEERLHRVAGELNGKMLYIVGDATEDEVLTSAGIERAGGLVSALTDDRDNLYVTISARSLNSSLRIVAKAVSVESMRKLQKAGADATVSPHRIGGLRLVTELVRPHTAEFLDRMMRGTAEEQLRFEDVAIHEGGPYAGKTIRQAPIREEANVLVVAVRKASGEFIYNPPADQPLEPGAEIIVLGTPDGVQRAKSLLGVED